MSFSVSLSPTPGGAGMGKSVPLSRVSLLQRGTHYRGQKLKMTQYLIQMSLFYITKGKMLGGSRSDMPLAND